MQKDFEKADFNKTVGPSIGKTYKMMSIFICDQFLKNDIQVTKEQWIVLKILHEQNKSICQNELAFITNRNKTTLTRLINVMEKNQLVERLTSKKDARKKLILITAKGEKLFLKMKPIMFQIMNIFQKGISNQEMETFIKITNQIQNNIKNQSL
ncbi:MarR family winged helix-turn-helix transcriptional regulator [Lutibacter aestuarii]|uniref:MarR family winged helix-turn-helix transcriptional regulator n=1 Tax=Lutibacter aestuarii TaxID=861111 RepID=A0ABW2Z7X3_9FLAO